MVVSDTFIRKPELAAYEQEGRGQGGGCCYLLSEIRNIHLTDGEGASGGMWR